MVRRPFPANLRDRLTGASKMSLRDLFRRRKAPDPAVLDPFDHPEVMRMSLRELADLPWPGPGAEHGEGPRDAASRL